MPGASSPDIDRLRSQQFQIDPTIGFRAGAAKRNLNNSFINPLGGNSTPQRDEAIRRSQSRDIDQQAAMESRAGQFDVNRLQSQNNQFLAGLTAPPLVNSGSTSTGQEQFRTPFSAKIMPALQSAAQVAAAGASDGRLKDTTGDYLGGLDAVLAISPKTFTWKDGRLTGEQAGLIAQNVRDAVPLAVNQAPDGTLMVNYLAMIGTLVNAVKELSAKVEQLEAR